MAFTVSLTAHIHGATQCKKFPPLSSSLCNLSSSANVVDMRLVSRCGLQKVGSNHRNFRVNALFGGKKDNEQSGDKSVLFLNVKYFFFLVAPSYRWCVEKFFTKMHLPKH
ncbi:nucleoid-associated protein, chloroplastic [Trifolium repens]|nr:nucleoid-associated protein, chloroplastic [Trifolium repens]